MEKGSLRANSPGSRNELLTATTKPRAPLGIFKLNIAPWRLIDIFEGLIRLDVSNLSRLRAEFGVVRLHGQLAKRTGPRTIICRSRPYSRLRVFFMLPFS